MPSKCYELKSLGLKTNFETRKYSKLKHNGDRAFEERVREVTYQMLEFTEHMYCAHVPSMLQDRLFNQ